MIVRRRHTANFTIIGNIAINDERLSYPALGVLTYLLSKPHDWQVKLDQLCRRGRIGRDKMRGIMTELMDCGYVLRTKLRDPSTGAFKRGDYVVHDEPQRVGEAASRRRPEEPVPAPENPAMAEPEPSDPVPEKPSVAYKEERTKDGEQASTDSTQVERESRRARIGSTDFSAPTPLRRARARIEHWRRGKRYPKLSRVRRWISCREVSRLCAQ